MTSTTSGNALPTTMRAWTHTKAGSPTDVLTFRTDVPVPSLASAPPGSVLVRVSHTAVHAGSVIFTEMVPFTFFRATPAIPETDFSGFVAAASPDAPPHLSVPGTPVFGSVHIPEHLSKGSGALAEYVVVGADRIVPLTWSEGDAPPSDEIMAAASALAISGPTALPFIEDARLREGMTVVINAPCGGVGHMATQMVRRAVGPRGKIVGVCSGANAAAARDLGCDLVVAYDDPAAARDTPLAKRIADAVETVGPDGSLADAMVDCYGAHELWLACETFLKPEAVYASVGAKYTGYSVWEFVVSVGHILSSTMWPSWLGAPHRKHVVVAGRYSVDASEKLRAMLEDGSLKVKVRGPWRMEDAPEAYRSFLSWHGLGKVVIKVAE